MASYLITYDLNREVRRPKIVDAIREFGTWAKLSESSYAIVTWKTADQVYDDFKQYLDNNDSFYVISLRQPLAGQGDAKVNEWLQNQILW
ncbi:hypothetical protein D2T31_11935 [Sinirhodobacter populi]|uniref:Uncharacterized protein n=1 Tax=Paenirhodobacter populi TaxID=2306993 RepID=A0A443K7W0_9RHOB|nr:hypothetical protein [Sinirhodobacter populi]RWR28816.1 hypothetical protein D2T31_11935 [Sinirhodobacter populi]